MWCQRVRLTRRLCENLSHILECAKDVGEYNSSRKFRYQVKEIKFKIILYNLSTLLLSFAIMVVVEEFYRPKIYFFYQEDRHYFAFLSHKLNKWIENMKDDVEDNISKFYNINSWKTKDGVTEDARRFEDLRENASEYVSKCRLRVLKYIPDHGENLLDMASGPIQYKEYLEYSKNFKRRYCIDLSDGALEQAKMKIGEHGVFLWGNFFDINLEKDFFDCSISLHTIYHFEKNKQDEAIRKLIYVTKPGKNVIIVYSNPRTLINSLCIPFWFLKKIKEALRRGKKKRERDELEKNLYSFRHPNEWWNRFCDIAFIKIVPWRSMSSEIQKRIIPDNRIGKKILELLFNLEERFPDFFVKYFQYPMIILTKR